MTIHTIASSTRTVAGGIIDTANNQLTAIDALWHNALGVGISIAVVYFVMKMKSKASAVIISIIAVAFVFWLANGGIETISNQVGTQVGS
ncbi:hypothetical protein NY551_18790 [Curtobacterium flaccumfaciens pv. oortii]|uniref:hypothetical protein n=1 Tax=Curtobacterium flaccumfaciens TaxID=2035 RepID=UPI00265ACCF5|nr:hypothetical protein [Curtobacterium flaccumfaciens]MCS5524787.1 hypothetical protein [Curtobacterium flaccumfaciens pv. oortii]